MPGTTEPHLFILLSIIQFEWPFDKISIHIMKLFNMNYGHFHVAQYLRWNLLHLAIKNCIYYTYTV